MRRGAVRLLLFDESWMGPGYRAIVGYKGFGAVGLIALLHLVESLGMERVGVVATSGGPEYAFRDERGIAYPFEVYVERERRLLALVSRELPARPVRAEYVWRITRLARRAGAEVLLAVGGLDSRYKQSPSDQARWVANRHYRGPLPPDPELERGLMVVGPLALQLMFSEALAIPTLAILPYARADAPDPAAAAVAVLRLNSLLGLDVAVEPLLAEAARIQAELSRLEEELGRAGRGEERPYIQLSFGGDLDSPSRPTPITIALLVVAWLSISSSSVLVLASGATALQAAFWRTALSSLALLALAPVLGGRPPLSPRAVLAGALLGLHFLTWMRSLFLIPVALSTSIVVWYPAISALIDRALLSERLERRQLAGLGIAGLGTLLLLAPLLSLGSSREQLEGAALAALGAALAAGYFSLGRAARVGGESLWSYATTAYLSASATLLLYSAASGESLTPPESSWPFLLALAAVPMFGGHTVMNYLLKHARTVSVTSIALGEPAGASLLALIALGQAPPRTAALGVPLTALGLALVVGAERKSSSRPSANIEGAGVPEPGQRGRT